MAIPEEMVLAVNLSTLFVSISHQLVMPNWQNLNRVTCDWVNNKDKTA